MSILECYNEKLKSIFSVCYGMETGGVSGVPRNFVRGGSTNSVEDRENRDLEAVAP